MMLKMYIAALLTMVASTVFGQTDEVKKIALASATESKNAAFFIEQNFTGEFPPEDLMNNYQEALKAGEKALMFSDSALLSYNDTSINGKMVISALKSARQHQEKTVAVLKKFTALSLDDVDEYSPKEALMFINQAVLDAYQASLTMEEKEAAASLPLVATTSTESGLVYRIQMGLFKQKIDRHFFGAEYELKFEQVKDDVWRYYMDDFATYQSAKDAEEIVKAKGYDAFLIAFDNGKKISITQAQAIEK